MGGGPVKPGVGRAPILHRMESVSVQLSTVAPVLNSTAFTMAVPEAARDLLTILLQNISGGVFSMMAKVASQVPKFPHISDTRYVTS